MIFMFFAAGISAVFFVCSLVALHCGRALGLRYRKHEGAASMAGLATVEGAIFGLMGLLLAFTISGALQRFDDRPQLVLQEATAVTTAYDRLGLSVSSRPRALAYSISASRAASQRSALVNSCVDITAPLTAPSQLMTIRTWVITSSSPFRLALRASAAAKISCFADDPDQQDRADPGSPMAHLLEKSNVALSTLRPMSG